MPKRIHSIVDTSPTILSRSGVTVRRPARAFEELPFDVRELLRDAALQRGDLLLRSA